jgi:hypothetical protein
MNVLDVKNDVIDMLKADRNIEYNSPNGLSAFYIQVTDSLGVKCFYSEYERNYSFKMMDDNPEYAPLVYDKFEYDELYCIVMENADIYTMNKLDHKEVDKLCGEVYKELKSIGINFTDNHPGNIAYLERLDKFVCIDWDSEGISYNYEEE